MFTVSVSVWGIRLHRTAFFYLMLGFFIDIYVGCGFGSIGENVDEPEEEEDTGGRK